MRIKSLKARITIMLLQILIPNGSTLIFKEPQEVFSAAPQNFDQCCVPSLKSYSKSFR
jgi:hypothetical protein